MRRHRLLTATGVGAMALVAVVSACVGDDPLVNPGGGDGTTDDAGTDAGSAGDDAGSVADGGACDRSKPFGAPVLVAELSSNLAESDAFLSADGLTVYFTRDKDLWSARRPTRTSPFADLAPITELNTARQESSPSITGDGLTLYYVGDLPDAATHDLFGATRPGPTAAFGTPTRLAFSADPAGDECAKVMADRSGIYSTVYTGGYFRLNYAPLPAGPLTEIDGSVNIAGASSVCPVVAPDELTMVFASDYGGEPAHMGSWDVYVAQRASKSEPWGAATIQPGLSSTGSDIPSWLSPDGCELWIGSDRGKPSLDYDIYVARRP